MGEGLQGFAEAHVIGEDAVQAVAGEKLHPVKTGELIVAQGGMHARVGRNGLDAGKVVELGGELCEVRRGFETKAFEPGERCGIQCVEARFFGKLGINQRSEMMQDAAHAADREFQGISIRQRCVDITEIRAVEGFLQKIAFQQLSEDRQQVVAFAADIEADREAEPAAVLRRERAVPVRGIGLENAVPDVVIDGDGPAGFFETADHFAAEPVPEMIDIDAAGIGKPAVAGGCVFGFAGFKVEQEAPGGVGLERGEAGV